MMTKTNYKVIAELITIAKEHHPESSEGLEALTMMLAGAFGQENKHFRIDLFLTAAQHSSTNNYVTTTPRRHNNGR
jgi:hypothetical protein